MKRTIHLASTAILPRGVQPDVSFVPPLIRRRLSPLQKIFFHLARSVGAGDGDALVFASRDGEDALTRRLVDEFKADGSVSPHRFSSSVYNAAPGLWSVFTHDTAPYTAIASGEDTIECGLLEAFGAEDPVTFIVAEETDGGWGAAARFSHEAGARAIEIANEPGDCALAPERYIDFLAGNAHEASGRWLRLADAG